MFLFSKPLVGYVTSNSLELLVSNKIYTFLFPSELIRYSELTDEKKFGEAFLTFLDQLHIRNEKGVIFLSPKIVYTGNIATTGRDETNAIDSFVSLVPVLRENLRTVVLKNKDKLTIYATNSQIYEIVTEICKKKNIDIYAVVPANVLIIESENKVLTVQDVARNMGNKKTLMQYNFHRTLTKEKNRKEDAQIDMKKQYLVLCLSLAFLGGAIGYLLLWSGRLANPWSNTTAKLLPKVTVTSTPSLVNPTPTEKLYNKSSVIIQILNGSGVAGQAGKLSLLLENGGYKNITTGNATHTESSTRIVYASHIPSDIIKDVQSILKNDVSTIDVKEATTSGLFDITITTGKNE